MTGYCKLIGLSQWSLCWYNIS